MYIQLPKKPMQLSQKPMLPVFWISASTVLYALNPTKAVNLPQKPLLTQGDVADLALPGEERENVPATLLAELVEELQAFLRARMRA